jgi:hypothetical protein
LCRSRGRFTFTLRSASLTWPGCEPYQQNSPLALPGVRGPATCSALNLKISAKVWIPISWKTVSATRPALSIRFNNCLSLSPLNLASIPLSFLMNQVPPEAHIYIH